MAHISVINRAAALPRLQEIADYFNAGYKQVEIAREFGLSRERVGQLVKKARREGLVLSKEEFKRQEHGYL